MFKALQEEVRVASDVVAGTLPMNNFNVLIFFKLGATHFLVLGE
jgi:5,10-methylenetetrahydrofolate reductase